MFKTPIIMGILNVTPDSFSDGGQFSGLEQAVAHARAMLNEGADILDIGGESTRPGAKPISVQEEIDRVLPVVEALSDIDSDISIDTCKPEVAEVAIRAGATIWNDVTALEYEKHSPDIAAKLGCKVVLMHMQGSPENMQDKPRYSNVVAEVSVYLKKRVNAAIQAGVQRENLIIDPGIGFGKRLEDNLNLLQNLDAFHALGCPVLLGASRKSFIGALDDSTAEERLGGSLAAALWGSAHGASMIRVHDVKQTAQALKVWHAIEGKGTKK